MPEQSARRQGERSIPMRRFCLGLAILCFGALCLRVAMLQEFLSENPYAEEPETDGLVYWGIAGEIAAGRLIGESPFLFAPLYPYLLGVLRALGGGLMAVYVVQTALHLATAVGVALATQVRAGRVAGLVAAGLFLALTQPAVSSMRLLATTLQLFLVSLVWWRWTALSCASGRRWSGVIGSGCLIGILALAYPPAMLLVPVYALWLWWTGGRSRPAFVRAGVGALCALLLISPATVHNAVVSGEFLPITAHAGITLRQGNGPKAIGVFTRIPVVGRHRIAMHDRAASVVEKEIGRKPTWGEVNRYFRNEALAFWAENPARTAWLFARKAYWFLTALNYSDMMPTVLEREFGVGERAILAPLPTPFLIGAALAGLIALIHKKEGFGPELFLLALPLFTTIVFFYSPRYRIPAVPVFCALAAYSIVHFRRLGYLKLVAIVLGIAPIPLQMINQRIGFDRPAGIRAPYANDLSNALVRSGDRNLQQGLKDEAERRYQAAIGALESNAFAHCRLGALRADRGELDAAVAAFEKAAGYDPDDTLAYRCLYNIAVARSEIEKAAELLRRIARLAPDTVEPRLLLAWLLATCPEDNVRDGISAVKLAEQIEAGGRLGQITLLRVRAAAYAEAGWFDKAVEAGERALQLARSSGNDALVAQIETAFEAYRNRQPLRAPPRLLSMRPARQR